MHGTGALPKDYTGVIFCDGTVCVSGKLPVLMYDTQTGKYYSLGKGGTAQFGH